MRRNVRRGIFLFAMIVLVGLNANAQHNGVFSQYMFNTMVINPGYTGTKEVLTANMNLRQQWTGFSGAPTTQFLSVHSPLKNKKIAIGGMINREVIGVSSDFKVSGTFAYRLKTRKGKLSMGLSAGIGMSSANWSDVNTTDLGDDLFQNNENGSVRPVFGTGFFYSEKNWYVGYSIPSIMSYSYNDSGTKLNTNFNLNQTEHILNGGYVFEANRKLHVKPSMLLRVQPTNGIHADINTNVIFDNTYWVGLSYRTTKEIIAILEYNVNYKLKVGYAYDFNFSELSTYSSGSHELSIEYGWGMYVKGRSPRHF